jgi:hypothetical protein
MLIVLIPSVSSIPSLHNAHHHKQTNKRKLAKVTRESAGSRACSVLNGFGRSHQEARDDDLLDVNKLLDLFYNCDVSSEHHKISELYLKEAVTLL